MRQSLEAQARGRRAGIGIIGDQIAAANLDRIHPDLHRGQIDQTFRHRAGNRMPDRTVLAGDVLVLKDHAGPSVIVLGGVRPTDKVDHLVGLDRTGSGYIE